MNMWDRTLRFWRNQSITVKHGAGISLLLFLILVVALTGYFALRFVRTADEYIQVSTEIERFILEMDRGMERARYLHGQFFIQYPKIGLQKAHENFAQPSVRQTARVVASSNKLRELITNPEVSDALRRGNINLNLYLSSAKRFADTSIASFELVTRLATPQDGLEAELDKYFAELKSLVTSFRELSPLYFEMEHMVGHYLVSRERFLMQSAFNIAFRLRNGVEISSELEREKKKATYLLLDEIKAIADEILDVDVAIESKFRDFILQAQASDSVSGYLIEMAREEVKRSQKRIKTTYQLVAAILAAVTLIGLFAAAMIARVIHHNITRRIISLTDTAGVLRKDRFDVAADERDKDEIGQLGRTFNFMAARMKRLVDNLEREVRDRTSELRHVNENLQVEIRERKQAEQRFRMAAEATSDLVYEWTVEDNALLWFGDVDAALGYDRLEFPRNVDAWLSRVHPNDRRRMEEAVERHRTWTQPIKYEYQIQRRDGNWRWWFDYAEPVLADDGLPGKWIGICQDVTERKQAESEKQNLESQLRQSHKMEAIGTLAGGIAHDFNNILSAVIGYTELARLEPSVSSKVKKCLDEVLLACSRAKELVQHILSFSRKEGGETNPVNVSLIAREALKLLRATIPTTIEIREDIDPDCGIVLANATQIHQVLMNLCTNAAQAMEESGGVLTLSVKPTVFSAADLSKSPERSALGLGAYVRMTVHDTGPGIPPEIANRIFDPYFTTKDFGKGSGMGLSVAHGIVLGCSGIIEFENIDGGGAGFHVYLPLEATDGHDETSAHEVKKVEARGTEHVLMVDDEASLIAMNKKRLARMGYRVTTCTRSREALELFRAQPNAYDLVITDQTMPKMTGMQLARELLAVKPDVPIILCTGYSATVDPEKARQAGIRGFVMKPVEHDVFISTIRQVLDKA